MWIILNGGHWKRPVVVVRLDDLLHVCLFLCCRDTYKVENIRFNVTACVFTGQPFWSDAPWFIFSGLGLAEVAVCYFIGCDHPAVSHTGWHMSCWVTSLDWDSNLISKGHRWRSHSHDDDKVKVFLVALQSCFPRCSKSDSFLFLNLYIVNLKGQKVSLIQ